MNQEELIDVRPIIASGASLRCGAETIREAKTRLQKNQRKQNELFEQNVALVSELIHKTCQKDQFMAEKVLHDGLPAINFKQFLSQLEFEKMFEDEHLTEKMGRVEYLAKILVMSLFKEEPTSCYLVPEEELPSETMKTLKALSQPLGLYPGFSYEQRRAEGFYCSCVRFHRIE